DYYCMIWHTNVYWIF
nr:immunoglobulin light chain junction region [Macaca mulatta]